MLKKGIVILLFLIIGIIVSIVTDKYIYYMPTSLIVGILVVLFVLER